ncbi:MAG: response regulator [Pseudomonadota bacterium]
MNEDNGIILTIEDNPVIRQGIAGYLEYLDFIVLQAENGRIGLEIFHREKPDLVLVDLRMPEVDGLEVLAEVTQTAPETPIIVVSGTGVIGDAVEALRLGAWDYILKPIQDMAIIEHSINKALERSQLLAENRRHQEYLEKEIKKRTAELEQSNIKLLKELTERVRAEAELRASEEKHRTVLETNPDPVVVYDPDGRVIYFNPAFTHIFEWTLDDCLGHKMDQYVPEECGPETDRMITEIESGGYVTGFETMRLTRSGKKIPVTISAAFYKDQPGKHSGSVVTLRDITAQKQADAEKIKLEKQLRQAQKMEALGTLAGGVTHDFNNILQAIMGYAQLAQTHHPENQDLQHKLGRIFQAGRRAQELVSQILSFSRQVDTKPMALKISLILKEALKLIQATLPKMIEIRQNLRVPSGQDRVMADPTQIHQLMMNLCTNAAHAMSKNGGILEVSLTQVDTDEATSLLHVDTGSYLRLTVQDTGTGITPEVMELIFDPYFTTKKIGEGTGLGLAMVHGIVESHGGVIKVESEPGKGSSFHIYLPQIKKAVTPVTNEDKDLIPTGNEHILVIDDEKILAELIKELLKGLGYQVMAAVSSIEALELFRTGPEKFDLVITDQAMPKMTGSSLAVELIKIRPDIPIVLYTGFDSLPAMEQMKTMGIRKIIKKPVSKRQLAVIIREVLDESYTPE